MGAGMPALGQPAQQFGISDPMLGAGPGDTGGPIQAFAPTGLRDRALASPNTPVWGQGDVMAMSQGLNAQGGQKFALGQYIPLNGYPSPAPNPIAPSPAVAPVAPNPNFVRPGSPNAGLISAFPQGTIMGDYVRAQEAHRLPVDMNHLELLSKFQNEQDKIKAATVAKGGDTAGVVAAGTVAPTGDPVKDATAAKQAYLASGKPTLQGLAKFDKGIADAQKVVAQQVSHATTLSQINEQNNAVQDNLDEMLKLAPSAGPIMGRGIGNPGFDNVTRLHSLAESVAGNEMMDYIQRLKAVNPLGNIGFRVLDTEARAMSNVFAALKDDKVPIERQQPEFVKQQVQSLQFHLARMNMIAGGINPDEIKTESDVEALGQQGKLRPGQRIAIGKKVAVWNP